MLANPGFLSAADFAQLQGLAFDEKVRLMRAILNEVSRLARHSRSPSSAHSLGKKWAGGMGKCFSWGKEHQLPRCALPLW